MSCSRYGQTSSTIWGPETLRLLHVHHEPLPDSSSAPVSISPANGAGDNISTKPDPRLSALEVSIHTLPKPLQREFQHVFSGKHLLSSHPQQQQSSIAAEATACDDEILAILTNQKAAMDLVGVGDSVEIEKDRLLNVFMSFARSLCAQIRKHGFWADYIDPCSGLPMLTENCNKVYSEVDGHEVCLGYKTYNAGFCKILTHPLWGSAVYPASIFVHAPRDFVQTHIQKHWM